MQLFRNHILIFLFAFLSFSAVRGHNVLVDLSDKEPIEYAEVENLQEVREGEKLYQADFDSDPGSGSLLEFFFCGYRPEVSNIAPLTTTLFSRRLYLLFAQLIIYH